MSASVPLPAVPPRKQAPSPHDDVVTVHLDDSGATDFPFLLQRSGGRFSRSVGVSFGIHVIAILTFFILTAVVPALTGEYNNQPQAKPAGIIWLAQVGPGGGGGGGGNQSEEPVRKLELQGKDSLSMPAAPPAKLDESAPTEAPEKVLMENVTIPAMAMASGLDVVPGTPEGTTDLESLSQGSGTGGGSGTGQGTGIGSGIGSGFGPGIGGGTGGGVFRPGAGITLPRPIREFKPAYTADAMRAKIQGEVWLEAVVLPDGSVGRVEVVRSLDSVFGLDKEAIEAAKKWRFTPGLRFGDPVAVLVTISMSFTLR